MSSHPSESLTLRPDPRSWALTAAAYAVEQAARDRDRRVRMREQLGLPVDGLIIMSGHQAELWHPGILAKWFAMHAVVRQLRARGIAAHAAWLVVDQDANQPAIIHYPASDNGVLKIAGWKPGIDPQHPVLPDTPTGQMPPLRSAPPDFSSSPCAASLGELHRLLARHADAPNLAEQITRVLTESLHHWTEPASIIRGTELSRTSLMANLVKWMGAEANACVLAYNAAAITEPKADVRPLLIDEKRNRIELPLWRIRPSAPRTHVYVHELSQIPPEELAPRALLMTALVRIGACDLFIHGLGGEQYEQVTDRWLGSWIPAERPAPVAVASATRFIPGLGGQALPPSPDAIDRAVWLASHARNDPMAVGDAAAAERKSALVAQIRSTTDRAERKAVFNQMRQVVRAAETQHAPRLAELDKTAAELRSRASEAAVVYNRAWPFMLYPNDALARLKRDIDNALA